MRKYLAQCRSEGGIVQFTHEGIYWTTAVWLADECRGVILSSIVPPSLVLICSSYSDDAPSVTSREWRQRVDSVTTENKNGVNSVYFRVNFNVGVFSYNAYKQVCWLKTFVFLFYPDMLVFKSSFLPKSTSESTQTDVCCWKNLWEWMSLQMTFKVPKRCNCDGFKGAFIKTRFEILKGTLNQMYKTSIKAPSASWRTASGC